MTEVVDLERWNEQALAKANVIEPPRTGVDFEKEFCSHLCDREALVYFIQDGIKDDLLFTPSAKAVYAFARTEYERSKNPPTAQMLTEEFPQFEFIDPETGFQWLAEKLRNRYRRGQVQEATRRIAELTKEPDEAFAYMREKVFEIEQKSGSTRKVFSFEDVDYFIDRYQKRVLDGFMQGFTTGFRDVDELSGGIRPGQLAFLLARPKRFKTFFLCNAFVQQRIQGKIPLLATLEMTEDEIWGRIGCIITGLSFDDHDKGRFGPHEWKIWKNGLDRFAELGPAYLLRPPVGERTVSEIFLEADKHDAESVIIDQLSFLESTKTSYTRDDLRVAEVVYAMKNFATRSGSERPVLCAAQFNREADRLEEMAGAAKAALSGSIEQAADALYALHRTEDMRDSGVVQFGLIESRSSDIGDWMVDVELRSETRIKINTSLS